MSTKTVDRLPNSRQPTASQRARRMHPVATERDGYAPGTDAEDLTAGAGRA